MAVAGADHGRKGPNPLYPANLREFARRLYEQNGWSPYRIRKAIIGRGYDPAPAEHTIRTWVDDDYRDEHLKRGRSYRPAGPARQRAWALRLSRMEELRRVGLSYRAIAALMTHDFKDVDVTADQAERILKGKVSGRTIRRLLWPKGARS